MEVTMKNNLKALACLLVAVMLLGGALLPVTAHAASFAEDNARTFANSNVNITVGSKRDMNDYVITRVGSDDDDSVSDAFAWSISGKLQWASSDPKVATVDEKGIATALKIGVTKITATGWDNYANKTVQTIVLGVSKAPDGEVENSFTIREGTRLNLRELLHPGYTADGSYGAIAWSSNGENMEVNADGILTANSVGSSIITASYTDPEGAVHSQRVKIRVTTMLLENRAQAMSIQVKAGDTVDLIEVLYPGYSSSARRTISITTDNSDIVKVSGDEITGKAVGVTKVSVSDSDDEDDNKRNPQRITVSVIA